MKEEAVFLSLALADAGFKQYFLLIFVSSTNDKCPSNLPEGSYYKIEFQRIYEI